MPDIAPATIIANIRPVPGSTLPADLSVMLGDLPMQRVSADQYRIEGVEPKGYTLRVTGTGVRTSANFVYGATAATTTVDVQLQPPRTYTDEPAPVLPSPAPPPLPSAPAGRFPIVPALVIGGIALAALVFASRLSSARVSRLSSARVSR